MSSPSGEILFGGLADPLELRPLGAAPAAASQPEDPQRCAGQQQQRQKQDRPEA